MSELFGKIFFLLFCFEKFMFLTPGTLGGSPNGHVQFGVTTGLGGPENRNDTKKRPEQCLNHLIFTSRPILGHWGTF